MNSLVPCRCGHPFDDHRMVPPSSGPRGVYAAERHCSWPDCHCSAFEAEDASEARETVASIGAWSDETFGAGDPTSPRRALRLLEEVVELCLACGADGLEVIEEVRTAIMTHLKKAHPEATGLEIGRLWSRKDRLDGKIPGELADCNIVLATIAHQLGVDLQDETDAKMKINRNRTWNVTGDGTGQHV